MEFKSYCLVVLGRVEGVKDEIGKISETAVRYVDAKGIVIATFSTVATALELREFFTLNNRSFVLFEMGDGNYGANLTNKAIHDHLFGDMEVHGMQPLNTLTGKLLSDINGSVGKIPEPVVSGTSETRMTRTKTTEFDSIDLKNLSIDQRSEIVNKIIDKGVENLTEQDKKVLKKLSKPTKN
jgi:hypothetical protein